MPETGSTPAASAAGQSRTIAAVERAMDVLLLFARPDVTDLGVTEISTELGLSKAAAHRILTSLRSRKLVVIDPDTHRYALGSAAVLLGRAYLEKIDIRSLAAADLSRLSAETEETATLSIRSGDSRIYVDQVAPAREVRMEVTIGRPYPLHAGSSSKSILAYLGDDEIEAYLGRNSLTAVTDQTIVDAATLRDELAQIRERGYAMSYGERMSGAGSVAAPVFDHDGAVVAAISVSGPIERFREHQDACVEALRAAASRLSAGLGYHA